MAAHAKNAASSKEIDGWVDRIEEITSALNDYLSADPLEEAKRKEERAKARKKAEEDAAMRRVRERYDSKRYKKFEDDQWIEEMMAACDAPPKPAHVRHTDLTPFEKVTLREAEEEKKKGNAAIASGDYPTAFNCYSNGIGMDPCDDALLIALRNNRAQAALSVGKFEVTVEDASFVLTHQRHNAKALLRRATALSALYRPREAMEDLKRLLIAEPKNVEGLKLKARVADELTEYEELAAFKKMEEGQKKKGGGQEDDENNVERLTFLASQLVDLVKTLSNVLSEKTSCRQPAKKNADKKDGDGDDDAIAGVGPSTVSAEEDSGAQQSDKSATATRTSMATDKDVEAVLKTIVDVLCEAGGILAVAGASAAGVGGGAGPALLWRSQKGLHATWDIVTLLTTNPKSIVAVAPPPLPQGNATTEKNIVAASAVEKETAAPTPLAANTNTTATPLRTRPLESLLLLPMTVVCLTCAYRVLSYSFPSTTSRRALIKDIIIDASRSSGGGGVGGAANQQNNILSIALGNNGDGSGKDSVADEGTYKRPLLLATTTTNTEEGEKKIKKLGGKDSCAAAAAEELSPAVFTVEPLSVLAMAVVALCASTPSALQSALASSATLRSYCPWAMLGVMHTRKHITSDAASCLFSLGAYPPLHAACGDFLAAAIKEESGQVLSLLFVGDGTAMLPPMWSVGSLMSVLDFITSAVKTQRRGGLGLGLGAAGKSASAVPSLTSLLNLTRQVMSHAAPVLSVLNGGAGQQPDSSNAGESEGGEGGKEEPSSSCPLTSALSLLERGKNSLHGTVIPSCLAALDTMGGEGGEKQHKKGTNSSNNAQAFQELRLQEAALEVLLVVPSRCYQPSSSATITDDNEKSTPASDGTLVRSVLKHILPCTLGAFGAAFSEWCRARVKSKKEERIKTPPSLPPHTTFANKMAQHSYKSEACLAIVYNTLIQASPSTSTGNGTLSDRARLVETLREKTRLYSYASHIIEGIEAVAEAGGADIASSLLLGGGVSGQEDAVVASNPLLFLISNHLNVVARLIGVLDRTAGASEVMAGFMRGENNAHLSSAPPLPPVMKSMWAVGGAMVAMREQAAKREASSSSSSSSVGGGGAFAATAASTANGRRYDDTVLEHISILMATLFFSQTPAAFQREFAVLPRPIAAEEDTNDHNHHNAEASADNSNRSHVCGEYRLRLLLNLLKFQGEYKSVAAATNTTATASNTTNSDMLMHYFSNAVFIGNVALLLGRVPAGALVALRPETLKEKEAKASVAPSTPPSASSAASPKASPSPQSLPFTVAGAILVQSDAVKLAIDAICAIRSAANDLQRDISKCTASASSPSSSSSSSPQQQQLLRNLQSQLKHLRSAQKNLATMVSKWLTGTVDEAEVTAILEKSGVRTNGNGGANTNGTDSNSGEEASKSSKALVVASSSPSTNIASSPSAMLEQRRQECSQRLTGRLRDVKGFEVLAISLKETS